MDILARVRALKDEYAALLTESQTLVAEEQLDAKAAERHQAIMARLEGIKHDLKPLQDHLDADRAAPTADPDETAQPDPTLDVAEAVAVERASGDPMCGFHDMGEFAQCVHAASRPGGPANAVDQRLLDMQAQPAATMHEPGGTAGEGFLVPPQLKRQLFELVFVGDQLLNLIDIEPTASSAVDINKDPSTPWGATGITAAWRGQLDQMAATALTTEQKQTRMYDLYALVVAADDLLEDAPRLTDRLTRKSAEAIRWEASKSIALGTGAGTGQPTGFLTHPAVAPIAPESAALADGVSPKDIATMWSRQLSISNSSWLISPDVFPELYVTKDAQGRMLWMPPAGLSVAPYGTIMGRPMYLSDHLPTFGTPGDIVFFSPTGYHAIGKARGINFASSIHLYFDYGLTAFRWTFRFGGQPYLDAPVVSPTGTARSHFLTIDTRA